MGDALKRLKFCPGSRLGRRILPYRVFAGQSDVLIHDYATSRIAPPHQPSDSGNGRLGVTHTIS